MSWKIGEFRNLCVRKNLPDSSIYQRALFFKEIRALLLAKESQLVWERLYVGDKVIRGPEKMETRLKSEAFVEAAALAMHSMADIMAQIINLTLFRCSSEEGDVTFNRVHCRLCKEDIAPAVATAMKKLRDSDEFKYVDAFVNTIKHRRLIFVTYDITRNERMKFKAFLYRNKNFADTWAVDIIDSYIPRIIDLICDIGNAMNTYLQ